MMIPATAFSSPSSSSANSVVIRVDKATSEFLNGPDWTLNIDICDTINANSWLSKDVVKTLKKRLQHKNPNVQLLSLTLLETMVKNCGEYVHFQIAERNILPEMIKIVKKKADMRVREKILVLLDSWQEAFGGRGGKYPQYYFAYDELRQSGVQFPHRSPDAAPILTPPVTYPPSRSPQPSYGMPSNSSTRLDEVMASEIENLSASVIDSMKSVSDLLSEMLQEVDPNDRAAVKDEVIVDIVDRCRSNQKKLMQMLSSASDEELLGQGIELNDNLQTVLAKHDAIASGSPIPVHVTSSIASPSSSTSTTTTQTSPMKPVEEKDENSRASVPSSSPIPPPLKTEPREEEEEDEDDFALLARRHSKPNTPVSQNGVIATESGPTQDPSMSMALTVTDPLSPPNTTRADDMIDFLSLTLSTVNTPSPPPVTPPQTIDQNIDHSPSGPATAQSYPHQTQPPLSSYVVPWAQSEPQMQPQVQPQYQQQGYIPPPWAATPGYYTNNPYASSSVPVSQTNNPYASNSVPNANNPYASHSVPQSNNPYALSYNNVPSQQVNSYSNNMTSAGVSGDGRVGSNAVGTGQKPFIPSYRLFEDLNVLGNQKTGGTTSNFPGTSSGQSMMGGKK
ncbi:TOM1-like protein 6 [Rutidosis leptorrhynchoides]|uniref:TOM1-like protein 6 n=1 Tax=Rutidosis leptorrhynchoides TaxID=125765 RepID=UPI003A9A3105